MKGRPASRARDAPGETSANQRDPQSPDGRFRGTSRPTLEYSAEPPYKGPVLAFKGTVSNNRLQVAMFRGKSPGFEALLLIFVEWASAEPMWGRL
jgi:hypothetical protein